MMTDSGGLVPDLVAMMRCPYRAFRSHYSHVMVCKGYLFNK